MKVAICGYPPLAKKTQDDLKNDNIEVKFFIKDLVSSREKPIDLVTDLPLINFFQFRQLVNAGELDGVIIAEDGRNDFTKNLVLLLKLYEIPQVGIIDLVLPHPINQIYWLDPDKAYISYLNTNLVDGCNLNCKGCTHFAVFFKPDEIYPLETFRRDVRRLSQMCDVIAFRLLGGEPLLLKNLDKYIKIARQYLPKSNLGIVTNGLLIPSLPQKILDSLRKNDFMVYVSVYEPTTKILDKIKAVLEGNKIFHKLSKPVKEFGIFITLHSGNNPKQARKFCAGNEPCRFLRDGKIYKCPPDALKYRLVERFGIEGLPEATSVDLYAPNFPLLLKKLDGNVEMCYWCSEQKTRRIQWEVSNKPKLEDWLAEPEEIKKFQ